MTLIGILLLVGAAYLGTRWWLRRYDTMGRPRPFPMLSVALLVVLGGGALVPGVLRARLESRLSAAATRIVGSPVDVECQSFGKAFVDVGAEAGYVAFRSDGTPEPKTIIKRDECRALADYLRSDKTSPTVEQVRAVHVVTHETIHMSGIRNESHTECLAVQRNAEMARLLGAPADGARLLAKIYWTNVYPQMPDDYRTEGCGPNGELDTGSADAPWAPAG